MSWERRRNSKGEHLALEDFAPGKGKGLIILLYGTLYMFTCLMHYTLHPFRANLIRLTWRWKNFDSGKRRAHGGQALALCWCVRHWRRG